MGAKQAEPEVGIKTLPGLRRLQACGGCKISQAVVLAAADNPRR